MINKAIIKAVLNSATKETKDKVLNELLKHISMNYDYNDSKAGHVLEMLVDCNSIITCEDVNMDYINRNLKILMYTYKEYNIKNIKIDSVDNIDCTIKITFEYLEKVNEDRDDVSYQSSYSNVSFIDNPGILKKEC